MLGCFQPNFVKKQLKITKRSDACQSFRITAIALKLFRNNSSFYVLFGKVIYIRVGLPDFREGQVGNLGQKGEISHFFQGFRKEYVQIVPKWLGGP